MSQPSQPQGQTLTICLPTPLSPSDITGYNHHGHCVKVAAVLKGHHRDCCLCHSCGKFKPGDAGNCAIAAAVYANCVKFGIVTPMWECPKFGHKDAKPA